MKFSTDKTHRDYFYKHGVIEFDELFTPTQLKELNTSIDTVLCTKLSIKPFQLAKQMPNALFLQGHDLFRNDETIKKLILHRRLAEIAVELMETHFLRMGYDQLLVGEAKSILPDTPYNQYLNLEGTLQEKSCIKPVICGLLLCLEPAISTEIPPNLFPKVAGSGVFFKPDIPFNFSYLCQAQGGRYLLLAFADFRTVYILNEKDPHTHTLKHVGYVFGDKLSDKLNPIVYRHEM